MEKVIYALWQPAEAAADAFRAHLLTELPRTLAAAGAAGIRINVRDAAAEPASGLMQSWQVPQQDAVVQLWLPSANKRFRAAIDDAVAAWCGRFAAWLVAESTIIANTEHPPVVGQRTWGWSQASFISFRSDMTREKALAHWHSHHTRVAIETQSNFEYIQNLIVLPLTDDAPGYDAFVEECFPAAAMTDPATFFDAVDDPARFEANTSAMLGSCQGFIDFARIDVLPTSQFCFGG